MTWFVTTAHDSQNKNKKLKERDEKNYQDAVIMIRGSRHSRVLQPSDLSCGSDR